MDPLRVDKDKVPYPDTTHDFVKVLREMGLDVQFTEPPEQRRYVGFRAFEVWLPILQMTYDVLIALEAGILIEVVKSYIGLAPVAVESVGEDEGRPDPLLHVDWRVTLPDGREEQFTANGASTDVLASLETFENHVRDL